jgi:PAS domain S-box-containing protein
MSFLFNSPYIFPLLVAAMISGVVAVYAWTRRGNSSAVALALLGLAIAEWSLAYVLEIAGADLSTKLLWGKLQYLGIATMPLFWVIFAFNHANQGKRLTHRRMLMLSAVPALTIVLAFTTERHGLIWKEFSVANYPNFSALDVTHGSWFWVHTVYSYILLSTGTYIIFRSIGRMEGLYRGQTAALIIALLAPWIGNALYLSGFSPIPGLDITPFAFTVTVAGLAWGIFGFRLMDLSPIARDTVVEAMREGMLVLDNRGRVADINPAAARMIGVPVAQALGKPGPEILAPWPNLVERVLKLVETSEVITVGRGEAQRHYDVQITLLQDRQKRPAGQIITLRDTDQASLPEPRFAVREPELPRLEKELLGEDAQQIQSDAGNKLWRQITNFFLPPSRAEAAVQAGINPAWSLAMERVLTIILRVAAIVGTVAFILSLPEIAGLLVYTLADLFLIALLWGLSIWRSLPLRLRTRLFLVIIYILAFVEIFNFGYSVEAFIFFIALAILGVLLEDLRGGLWALMVSLGTLGVFGWLISHGLHHSSIGSIPPASFETAFASLTAYAAISGALLAAINTLMGSLNRAWQKETQALNLFQQERDLLEQRVTERTQALAEARDLAVQSSNELRKYFLAIEQSGNTIVITDTKGRMEYVNPKFEALTGYSRAEVMGQNPRILKSGEHDPSYYKNLWETIAAGKIWHGELHNRRKDGSLFWEIETIAPLVNEQGEIINYVAIKEDISSFKELQRQLREQNEALLQEVTARERATLQLQESEARFRQIVENASDIIYRTDVRGYINYANPTAVRLMDFASESAVIGTFYLDIAIPAARQKLKRFYDRQFLSRTPASYYEFPAITQNGREIWLGQSVQLIMEGETVLGFQAVARDITAIKQAQEALAISRDQALEASRLKSQLLSRVSHELRTPLGTILGYAELLAMSTFGDLNEEQKDATAQIMASSDYLSKMVNDLLDEAQVESKKMSLRQTLFSPADMLQKVQAGMDVLARNKGLVFSTFLAPELPERLYGDERRLQQILINLCGNAVKFTQTGRVEVKIYRPTPIQWVMQVSDTGAGIPKEAQTYIFEPFRQVDNTITHENRGSGLGLSITKQLVELMDGEIDLESEPGQGSTFTITLPLLHKAEKLA